MIDSGNFLGLDDCKAGEARIHLIPVPIEWSTSYRTGTADAPRAIIAASHQIELYNAGLGVDLEGAGIATVKAPLAGKDDLVSFVRTHRERLLDGFACFIGGEHSITPWILEALACRDIGIVWLDAHADLRESYLGETESHACAARNSLRYGSIVEIGVRSYSKAERDFLSKNDGVLVFERWGRDAREAVERLPGRVYLSLDFDGLDPSLLRAVGTPEPGGLSWHELMDLLTVLFEKKTVIAMDAVELCPAAGDETSDFIAAKVVYEAVSRFLKGGGRRA
jgi:agmatinase